MIRKVSHTLYYWMTKLGHPVIYHEARPMNQYHGIRDRDLAFKLAEFLGVETQRATELALGMRAEVAALKEAADEL